MNELFNFNGTFFLVQANWVWMLAALGLGIWVGWVSRTGEPDKGGE